MALTIKVSLCFLLMLGAILVCRTEAKQKNTDEDLDKALAVIKIVGDLAEGVFAKGVQIWSAFEQVHDILSPSSDYELKDNDARTKLLLDKVDDLASDMKDFKEGIFEKLDEGSDAQDLKLRLGKFTDHFTDLSNIHRQFSNIVNPNIRLRKSTIKYYSKSALEIRRGVAGLLHHIHVQLLDKSVDGKTVFEFLADAKLKRTLMCPTHRSSQQNIYLLYHKILLHEIYGYMMIVLASRIREEFDLVKYGKDDDLGVVKQSEEEVAEINFYKRMNTTLKAAKIAMSHASRDVWRCDPYSHTEGETYDRFGPVFQKYVISETDLDKTCWATCPSLDNKKHTHCEGAVCQWQKRCTGRVRDCEHISKELKMCPANDGYRRYEYIETGDGKLFGDSHTCKSGRSILRGLGYTFFWTMSECTFCVCTCEEDEETEVHLKKHVNLRPVVANISANNVITGIRFVNNSDIFHIQIQQGQLLPNGRIDGDTVDWKPIDVFTTKDKGVVMNVDYHNINWGNRTLHLVDRESECKNCVVTGIKFARIDNVLTLAVQFANFDFRTGKIDPDTTFWDSRVKKSTEIELEKSDIPTRFRNNQPRSKSGEYVVLTTSDLEKDAGQNVIPFLDIQPVITEPPALLSGAGIHLKSEKHSAGFLALKVFTYNIEPHLKTEELTIKIRKADAHEKYVIGK